MSTNRPEIVIMKSVRPAAFVLVSTHHGTMIVNRNDFHRVDEKSIYGVGHQLMARSCYDQHDVQLILELLQLRLQHYGPGVTALDCGANIGVHSIEWANLMTDWGQVHAFEAQEKIFYALAGNIVINNCLNVHARHVALGDRAGTLSIPEPNYLQPGSFGSFELRKMPVNENIGQKIDYAAATTSIDLITLDSLALERVDLIKIDVEGMEEEVLNGSKVLIGKHKPLMYIEVIKSNQQNLRDFLRNFDYALFPLGMNMLAIHKNDACLANVKTSKGKLSINKGKSAQEAKGPGPL